MNVFQRCPNTSELEPLYLPQQLFVRPIAKLSISLQLPNLKKLGKSVSHWEIMDKLKELITPDEFTVLKVTKTTMEFVRFEAEVEKRSKLERVISKVDNKMIKLKDFGDLLRVRAAEFRSEFPNRRAWDAFFSEAKDMDEMKPGERPDTIHIANIPSKWFIPFHMSNDEEATPSEKIFYRVFEKFGHIRNVDIPLCDPYRKKMKDHISGLKYSSFEKMDWFEGYIQFKDYISFTKAMDFFRDRKLVRKDEDGDMEVELKVEFDKIKHLSDAKIRRREIVRDRLVKKAREKEEKDRKELEHKKQQEEAERKKGENLQKQKEIRRRMREEKRKAKILKKLEITGSDEINEKIAREEKKLLRVQRKLEAIRLVEELFKRIKEKNEGDVQHYDVRDSRGEELKRLKNHSELDYLSQKEKLHNAVKGRVMLKSILSDNLKTAKYSDTSDSELSLEEDSRSRKVSALVPHGRHPSEAIYDAHPPGPPPMYGFPYQHMYPPFAPPIFPDIDIFAIYRGGRGRGAMTRPGRGRGRGGFMNRGRGGHIGGTRGPYPPEVFEEYSKHYHKNSYNHHDRRRSRTPSPHSSRRRRSRSSSRGRSYSRSRSRSYSRRRSRSRSRSRSRRYSRHRDSRSRSRSRSNRRKSRSRSKERSRSRSRKESQSERRSTSNNRSSKSKTRDRKSRSRSKTKHSRSKSRDRKSKEHSSRRFNKDKSRSRSGSRAREKSVDSSKFMTPKQFMEQKEQRGRSRSKSWSLPKDGEGSKGRSWSRSPETRKK